MDRTHTFISGPDVELANSLSAQIAEWLAVRIFNGELKPAMHLKEEELAALFHTSRAPVREALYLLQVDGLVERLPRRGTVVRAYSDEDICDLYEVRATLESSTIQRLRTRWPGVARPHFEEILAGMRQAVEAADSQLYSEYNTQFHDLLFHTAGSQILYRLYHQLGHPLKYLLQSSTQSIEQMRISFDEHTAIIGFLDRGAFDEARQLLEDNVHHGLTRVMATRRKQQD